MQGVSSGPVVAFLAWSRPELADRLVEASRDELEIALAWPASDPLPELRGGTVLLVELGDHGAASIARAHSLSAAFPELLVVPVVHDAVDLDIERALREGGAADVVDAADLERGMMRVVALARRVNGMREERSRLTAGLAHSERLTAIGLLAAGVGHEINNPSTAILANTERVRQEIEAVMSRPRFQQADVLHQRASDWLEALGDVLAASRRITSIVRALHVFSRKNEDDSRPEPTSINDDVQTVMRLVGREVRYQAKVDLDLAGDLPYVMAPPHAMTQVVTNLVVNALQALESIALETRRLRVMTSHDDEAVCLEVADNGPGIAPETLERIFDPFFTTKEIGAGTGLGLSITRELVRRCGGEIFVESEPGFGARFRVILPRGRRMHSMPRAVSQPPPRASRLRLLIVEDDELLLRAMTSSLSEDFECTPAPSGPIALQLVRSEERFDALLSDIVMPGMDGLRLYEEIAELDPRLAARTLFVSGGLRSETLHRALLETGRPLLAKPFSMRDLARRIREVAA
ncbi:hybrid sensor histidine kinase/response regulator [Sandaracinus amylolyticus]|uniref:hybrid sensor histidine kinase/response regulator n=1 Tax=Sandaracinus amylolyticus TaxID=927083 RepID=UPI001F2864DD|nr:ATP-binding protein [Sandaracinus amylolyticus]UJR81341.1 Sensory box histidine kinase/response regulator [Sandaracinus amylolyticus]